MRAHIALLILLASAGAATTVQPPQQYPTQPDEAVAVFLFARETLAAQPVTPEVDAPRPGSYPGRAIELRARLRGRLVINADSPEGRRMLLRLELANGRPLYVASPSEVKGLREGDRIRVILEAPAEQSGGATFQLRAIVLEHDLPSERPLATPKAPAPRRPIAPASPSPTATATPKGLPGGIGMAIPPELRGATTAAHRPDLAPFEMAVPAAPRQGKEGAWDAVGNVGYPVISEAKLGPWRAYIGRCNRKLSEAQRDWIARWVIYYSALNGVDHRLMFAMIKCESDFNPFCVSRAGAVGLTQLMPFNLTDFKVTNRWNVQQQIRGGVEHFKEMLDMWKDRDSYEQFALAAASYNAGPNRVKRDGGIPNITETRNYVRKLGDLFYRFWQEGYP